MTRVERFALAALLLCACSTSRPVGLTRSLNTDTPAVCAKLCESMGMGLGAVVIISSSEGCVCEPRDAPRSASARAATAAIMPILEAEAAQQQSGATAQSERAGGRGH